MQFIRRNKAVISKLCGLILATDFIYEFVSFNDMQRLELIIRNIVNL